MSHSSWALGYGLEMYKLSRLWSTFQVYINILTLGFQFQMAIISRIEVL